MPKPVINWQRCKECELCLAVCPQKILKIGSTLNSQGFRHVICSDESRCTGCMRCAMACPDVVIEIHK